jgi:uncharacterized protein (UPF0303 family)
MPQKVLKLKDIEDQESRLIFKTFDEATALALGMRLVQSCQAQNLPVVINIRNTDRTFFHAALAGSAQKQCHVYVSQILFLGCNTFR